MRRALPAIFQFLIDLILVVVSLIVAFGIRMGHFHFDFQLYRPLILVDFFSYLVAFLSAGCYREYIRIPLRGHLHNGMRAFISGSFILMLLIYLLQLGYFTRTLIILHLLVLFSFLLLSRILIYYFISRIYTFFPSIKVKILSEGGDKDKLEHFIKAHPLLGYRIVEDDPDAYILIGHLDDCRRYIDDKRRIRFVPKNFLRLMRDAPLYDLPGMWITGEQSYRLRYKPLWDIIFSYPIALILTILSLPLFPIFAWLIKRDSQGPVFFRQRRYGAGVKSFVLYKFRTMVEGAERIKVKARTDEDPRVTRFGSFLRRTSLDELPQLFNVLRLDMNLVGPRPLIKKEIYRYRFIQKRRLSIKAGLTGLVQVSGRKSFTLEEMVILDLYYVEHWSPLFDLELLFMTIPSILIGKGAY